MIDLVYLLALFAVCGVLYALITAFRVTRHTCAHCGHYGAKTGACWCCERLGFGEHVDACDTCKCYERKNKRYLSVK